MAAPGLPSPPPSAVLQHTPVGAGARLPSSSEVRMDQELDEDLPQKMLKTPNESESTATVRAV